MRDAISKILLPSDGKILINKIRNVKLGDVREKLLTSLCLRRATLLQGENSELAPLALRTCRLERLYFLKFTPATTGHGDDKPWEDATERKLRRFK